jgi:hypothetical protein
MVLLVSCLLAVLVLAPTAMARIAEPAEPAGSDLARTSGGLRCDGARRTMLPGWTLRSDLTPVPVWRGRDAAPSTWTLRSDLTPVQVWRGVDTAPCRVLPRAYADATTLERAEQIFRVRHNTAPELSTTTPALDGTPEADCVTRRDTIK